MKFSIPPTFLMIMTIMATITISTILGHPQPQSQSQPDLPSPETPPPLSPSSPVPSLSKRRDCDSAACVTYFSDNGCTDGLALGSYRPDCSGHCFQYSSFGSIRVAGNWNTGVDCVAYSDLDCRDQIADSGNQHGRHCLDNLNGAQSMQCYYGCWLLTS